MGVKTFRRTIGNTWQVNDSFSSRRTNVTDTVSTGPNVPDYMDKIRSCVSATTSLTGTKRWSDSTPINLTNIRIHEKGPSVYMQEQHASGHWIWSQLTHPSAPTMSYNEANNAALQSFISSCTGAVRLMQGAVFIGEIREAIAMIRNPAKTLYQGVFTHMSDTRGRLRRRRFVKEHNWKPKAVHRMVSDLWLEKQFGWDPLLHDIDDGMRALASLANKVPTAKRVSGIRTVKAVRAINRIDATVAYHDLLGVVQLQEESVVRYVGAVNVQKLSFPEGLHRFGVSVQDVLPAIWELIPFSFLADYFSNLGAIIEAASFNQSSVKWVEKGQFRRKTHYAEVTYCSVTDPPNGYLNQATTSNGTCSGHSTYEEKARSDYSGQSLVPALAFRIPGSSTKWLNITALLASHRRESNRTYRR